MAVPTLRSLPFSPITERHKIFAFDMLYFLSKEYGTNWKPYGWKCYFTDPLSTWTSDMEQAARLILRSSKQDFLEIYLKLLPKGVPGHVHFFWLHIREKLRYHLENGCTPDELFESIVYVGRLSVEFYKNGIYNAPSYAILEIGNTLQKYMSTYWEESLFPAFNNFAFTTIKVHQNSAGAT